MKLTKLLFLCISLISFSLVVAQSNVQISGTVVDETGLPVPGATISEKGTQNATLSDIDGKYSLNMPSNATLVISFIGYTTQEIPVAGKSTINVNLMLADQSLEEVVVIGYGVQKKSVVTGAISQVKAEALEGQPVTRIEQSLQGRTSGVFVSANAGQPGSSGTVRVRGITTLNNNDPLYVVDGIIVDAAAVQLINQFDIESIEVLKDASAAVYGTQAAAGAILITTKKGKSGKLTVSYNGFGGLSNEARRVKLLDATQYATLMNERHINDGGAIGSIPYPDPQSYGAGTNWQDVIFQNAYRQSHDLSISGGTENSKFYSSFSLVDQEGIVLPEISRYQRKTFRLNSDHKIGKYIKVGQTATYSYEKTIGIGNTNSEFGGPLSSALNLDPLTPVVITDPAVANSYPYGGEGAQNGIFRDGNGNPYGISSLVTNEMANPLAYQESRRGQEAYAHNIMGNVYGEIEPIAGLKFRTTASGKFAQWGNEAFTPEYYFNAGPPGNNDVNRLYREQRHNFYWSVENTLSYDRQFGDHHVTALVGQGAYKWEGERGQGTTYNDLPIDSWEDASFGFQVPDANRTTWAATAQDRALSSLFARLTYDYKEKYLLHAFIRRDGSTQFGQNNKYGNFPVISLGWVPSKEAFWPENNVLTNLKFRGSYGIVGNDRIGDNGYLSAITGGFTYTFGMPGSEVVTPGSTITRPPNADLKWEETMNKNIAVEMTFFHDLTATFDLWQKKTSDILGNLRTPSYSGLDEPLFNIGEMQTSGFDIELGYRKRIGDFGISLNGNISFMKNQVNYITEGVDFYQLASVQSIADGNVSRVEVGQPFGYFYGYQTMGIFQNQAEIDAYVGEGGTPIQPGARPGDFRWQDTNGDGTITADDRVNLGSPLPDYTYGLSFNIDYKGFDLNVLGQGVAGNQIFNGLRRLELVDANFQANALNRWVGEGTSNTYPRMTRNDPNGNYTKASDFYLEDGDYFRIKTIQLGYSLPSDVISKIGMSRARIYVMGENLVTFTKYSGYDPEIGGGNAIGIDRGYYPQARSYMVGVNLQF